MSWIFLIAAGLCETAFTFCLGKAKVSVDAQWWAWISAFGLLYVLSAVLLAKAVQGIPVGVAYPVWTGIGAVGAVLISFLVFKEPVSFWKIFFLTTLIASVIGLKSVENIRPF
ncbi:MAG: multidrug efflux SMR transporter [Bacteroidales bacterium]|nr:multidrug efflux SMR transporter [Bacteroidales bacterium]